MPCRGLFYHKVLHIISERKYASFADGIFLCGETLDNVDCDSGHSDPEIESVEGSEEKQGQNTVSCVIEGCWLVEEYSIFCKRPFFVSYFEMVSFSDTETEFRLLYHFQDLGAWKYHQVCNLYFWST